MGSALYIVAKRKPADFDLTVDGKALARSEDVLSAISQRIGVKSPMDFFSQNPGDLADLLGEEIPDLPPEQWFEAQDGLQSVRSLIAHFTTSGEAIVGMAAVVEDLRQCERVLSFLETKQIQWHFALDV